MTRTSLEYTHAGARVYPKPNPVSTNSESAHWKKVKDGDFKINYCSEMELQNRRMLDRKENTYKYY